MSQFLGFGNGHDGSISGANGTINSYAVMTGTAGSPTVTTNLSVSIGDLVLLHQSRNGGSGAGAWELVRVITPGSGNFTADRNLTNTYATTGQAVLVPQYSGGTCGNTITGSAWDGTKGGIIALASTTPPTFSGSISADGIGYRGAGQTAPGGNTTGNTGEGTGGASIQSTSANGNGGGGGEGRGDDTHTGGGGGGGGNGIIATAGSTGDNGLGIGGIAGASAGLANLTTIVFGGGGGAGGTSTRFSSIPGKAGGGGGGLIFLFVNGITVTGSIHSAGVAGTGSSDTGGGGGGGGGGGSILIYTTNGVLGTNLITASAGSGGSTPFGPGGNGAVGRIHINYFSGFTGTTTPTVDSSQDTSLASKVYGGMI